MKAFNFPVSDEIIEKTRVLFSSWGIAPDDWGLATENAMQRFGYFLLDERNPKEIDIWMKKKAIPWKVKGQQWTCFPPAGSKWLSDMEKFGRRTGCNFHIVSVPFGPFKSRYVNDSPLYSLPSGHKVHARGADQYVFDLSELLTHKKTAAKFASRAKKWIVLVKKIEKMACAMNDKKTVKAAHDFYKVAGKVRIKKEKIQTGKELKGRGVYPGLVKGMVTVVRNSKDFYKLKKGRILVTTDTNPEFVTILRKAKAIITDRGGFTSHASIIAREFRIPCIVGTHNATKILKDGDAIIIDAAKGSIIKIKSV